MPVEKALFYGGNGWIGSIFTELLRSRSVPVVFGKARCNDIEAVSAELDTVAPTHVFMLAGRTHGTHNGKEYPTIDYLELPGKLRENVNDNLLGPFNLAHLCRKKGLHCTYMGTGCIFSYDDAHPLGTEQGFTEDAKPNFFGSSYSTVKGVTDQMMHTFDDCVLTLRLRMPISAAENPRNFINKIMKYEKICSIPNSMSVLDELLPIALDMAGEGVTGVVNFTNPGVIDHNEILALYRDIVDPTFKWKNFTEEEQAEILLAGRSNNLLLTPTMESRGARHIRDAIKDTVTKMGAGRKPAQSKL